MDMSNLYDNPKYYEIAFSFRNILSEVDLFEECFRCFSQIPVRSVLELGCGTCPHMEEFIKRGYQYNGLDLNKAILEYSRQKALEIRAEVTLFQGDMIDFSLERTVDFIYILLGSLSLKNTADLITHFNSVARIMKKGGLYLLDWCVQFEPLWQTEGDSWEMEQNGIQIKTQMSWKAISRLEQTFEETIILEVDDHGKK
jgi:SAM-dependent methyltransferase